MASSVERMTQAEIDYAFKTELRAFAAWVIALCDARDSGNLPAFRYALTSAPEICGRLADLYDENARRNPQEWSKLSN